MEVVRLWSWTNEWSDGANIPNLKNAYMLIFYRLLYFVLLTLHILLAGFSIYDLLTKSKRPKKILWFFILLIFPGVGALAYRITMKRRKRHHLFSF